MGATLQSMSFSSVSNIYMDLSYIDEREHVFVVGSARSGTSLVGTIIASSPLYALYRAETKLLAECQVKYGDIRNYHSRKKFLKDWFNSRQFKRTGLTRDEILRILPDPQSYYEFLGAYMGLVAEKQGRDRWVDSTPDNVECLEQIAQVFPKAKVIHVVRDGRAVAISKAKLGWSGVRTSNLDKALSYSALLWQRSVKRAMKSSTFLSDRYCEVKYEDLVENPEEVIGNIQRFLGIPELDKTTLVGEVGGFSQSSDSPLMKPNSIFGDMGPGINTTAAYRWKRLLTTKQICQIEAGVSNTLVGFGYPLLCEKSISMQSKINSRWRKMILGAKETLKKKTPLGRLIVSPLEIGEE